jgi:hypothetical protein
MGGGKLLQQVMSPVEALAAEQLLDGATPGKGSPEVRHRRQPDRLLQPDHR